MPVAMLSTNFLADASHPAHTGENGGSNFCEQQDALVIILDGGTKKRQQKDIVNAKILW